MSSLTIYAVSVCMICILWMNCPSFAEVELQEKPEQSSYNRVRVKRQPAQPITNADILSFSREIYAADANRMLPGDVRYNPNHIPALFAYVNPVRIRSGTYQLLRALLQCTSGNSCRRGEESAFLSAILLTGPMRKLNEKLAGKGHASKISRERLMQYWFTSYDRYNNGFRVVSSGFKHTFVGDIFGNTLQGLHNWLQVYLEQLDGQIRIGRKDTNEPLVKLFEYTWMNAYKYCSSMFSRTSPEVEIALYTLCFVARPGQDCNIQLDGRIIRLFTKDKSVGRIQTINTAYPRC